MKVIVNVSGFYGGTWFDQRREAQDMPDAVAKQFLPPHGDQLSLPSSGRRATEAGSAAAVKATAKTDVKAAG